VSPETETLLSPVSGDHPGVPGWARAKMARPGAAMAEAPWRGAPPWGDARIHTIASYVMHYALMHSCCCAADSPSAARDRGT
jgi:hypothetical protein